MIAWGCTCGRICEPDEAKCPGCAGPRSKGEKLENERAKKIFAKQVELADKKVLLEAKKRLDAVEKSFQKTAREFDLHATADYEKFDGWFGRWLRGGGEGRDPYGGGEYEDDYDFDD